MNYDILEFFGLKYNNERLLLFEDFISFDIKDKKKFMKYCFDIKDVLYKDNPQVILSDWNFLIMYDYEVRNLVKLSRKLKMDSF